MTDASKNNNANADNPEALRDFIRDIVDADLQAGKHDTVVTRFPPEPNGYLHIGHAKSICLNFGIAAERDGRCHLRFDDTNPAREEQRYIDAIMEDVRWLGFDWGDHLHHASDYFDQLYEWAIALIKAGKAYVDDQTGEEIRKGRGTLQEPGTNSPYRDRSPEENLDLFERMKAGEFPDGDKVLRAKIDMASPNINLRDPVLYRVLHKAHPRTGEAWKIYPMYDWAHGQGDWIEGVTHSLCTLEFEDHRPLYDWCIDSLTEIGAMPEGVGHRPRQYEFNRLNLSHTVTSKRKLRELVDEGHVNGWDDPRMPTLSGMRRRGYPPEAIREFCAGVGLSKRDQKIEFSRLEGHVRDTLNKTAERRAGVIDPLKVTITNWPEGQDVDHLEAVNNPEDDAAGTRQVPFSGTLYIEQEDFMEDPPKKFFRLGPGREVRLRYAYFITCNDFVKDDDGNVIELLCTYDPETRGGNAPDGRKVKGTIHWVSANHAVDAELRLYQTLFATENPDKTDDEGDYRDNLNPDALEVVTNAKVEPSLAEAKPGDIFQFERQAYFCVDPESTPNKLVFNRAVTLKDSWAKEQKKKGG